MRTRRTFVVSRLDQMAALSSPARQELLDVLTRMGAASLAEIGAVLGRPSDGLYYHVRVLRRVGLVAPAGAREHKGRREGLFRATATEFALRYASSPPRQARAVTAIVAGMLRLGVRDFRRGLVGEQNRVVGPDRDLWALRTTGWLLPPQVRRVNRLIQTLSKEVSRPNRTGRLYAVTVLLTPLDHRTCRTGRRPRKEAAR